MSFFPTPYPEEWWYSVLCRYAMRSGYIHAETAKMELFGQPSVVLGRLTPGVDCYTVARAMPDGSPYDAKRILLEHTLLPYHMRFRSSEMKHSILDKLSSGENANYSIQVESPTGHRGLKYCPICYREDCEKYGEPYWHRGHQIPLMQACPVHGCELVEYGPQWNGLSGRIILLAMVDDVKEPCSAPGWMQRLSKLLSDFLTLPFDVCPPVGYDNLFVSLQRLGYALRRPYTVYPTIDGDRFMAAIRELVSPEIVEQYFSVDTIQKLLRVVLQRKCAYPERYALVCLVAGISAETLFGPELSREDTLREQTVRLAASGRILKKSEVAAMLGIPCAMLDTAMKRYGIEPFWNWAKVKKEKPFSF